jgi:RNA polymerase sigma factor (sigma-70 family)
MNQHLGPMDEFIKANTGLVHHVAKRFKNVVKSKGLDYEDILQEGYIGLIKAYNRFDPVYGFQFATFAVPHIFGYIKHLIRDYGPVQAFRAEKDHAQHIFNQGLDDQSAAEIAERLGCTLQQATHALMYRQHVVISTDYPISIKDGQANLHDILPDHDDQTAVYVDEFLSQLPDRLASVARLRLDGKTQVEIAKAVGRSQTQIMRYMSRIGIEYLKEVM